jgi:hypothetical protein
MISELHRNQILQQKKLAKVKSELFREQMKEVRYTPDLSSTEKFNNKV